MKKIILICLAFTSLSAAAEIIQMDEKNTKNNRLFIDERGLYRYRRAKDIYEKECEDIFQDEIKKKCLEAERAAWEKDKNPEDVKREGSLFTGKILFVSPDEKKTYYYVNQGKLGKKIRFFSKYYYFENGLLYDIRTEKPYTGEMVIGGVKGLAPSEEEAALFIVQQDYKEGRPFGEPKVVTVKNNCSV